MTITLTPDVEAALIAEARRLRTSPERLALMTLRSHLHATRSGQPGGTAEAKIAFLRGLAVDCGVSLSDEASAGPVPGLVIVDPGTVV